MWLDRRTVPGDSVVLRALLHLFLMVIGVDLVRTYPGVLMVLVGVQNAGLVIVSHG